MEDLILESILKDVEQKVPRFLNEVLQDFISKLPKGKKELWQRILDAENKKDLVIKMMKNYIVKNYPPDSPLSKYRKESLDFLEFDFSPRLTKYIEKDFVEEIEKYLLSLLSKNDQTFFEFVSGKLRIELEKCLEFLENNPAQNEKIIEGLLQKAIEHPDLYEKIKLYKPIPKPEKELTEENVKDWLEEYFDYYNYICRTGKFGETEDLVQKFEKFYLFHYEKFTQLFISKSLLAIKKKVDEFLRKKMKVLLLIIDGLGYSFFRELKKLFPSSEMTFLFALPPTTTSVNKPKILSGTLISPYNIHNIFQVNVGESDSRNETIEDFLKKDFQLYIYYERDFDELIHRPMNMKKRRSDQLRILESLSEVINNFVTNGGAVIMVGDHGYTILPKDKSNIIDLEIENIHDRFANKTEELPKELKKKVYEVNRYIIPKGYGCLGSFPRGGTHGGLSPEEVVVPLIVLQPRREFSPLKFYIEGQFMRGKKHIFSLVIHNPNPFGVSLEQMQVNPTILKILQPFPIILEPDKNNVKAELDLTNVKTPEVVIIINYEVDRKRYEYKLQIQTKGAMVETFDLEW